MKVRPHIAVARTIRGSPCPAPLARTRPRFPHNWLQTFPIGIKFTPWSYATETCQVMQSPGSTIQVNSMFMDVDFKTEYTV